MSSIDERIVNMKFNNSQFENGIKQTVSSLDALKKGLQLDGAKKGLDDLDSSAKKFSLQGIADGLDTLTSKFSALSIIGITALTNIANRAIDAGLQITRSLTVEPIQAGLQEYETNLNSIQTILANTQASGATLQDVNGYLQELNTYSDKTIYNFSEMARNIGTFTAAGVDLKTSTSAIKGIANLAALSGSNSQQAATAMYQLSQAIASGKVGLQDWNSVVNAGMGGTTFQRALAQTAVAMGKLSSGSVKLSGDMKNVTISGESFRDSISAAGGGPSWLTSDVLTTTLKQFTGDLSDAEIAAMGFNEEQVKAIQQTAQTAMHAATEVKTLSAVLDTAKETAGSGWAQTWQIVFGDFGEAKSLFTNMSNGLNDMINAQADARNKILQGWKDLGGRTELINIFTLALSAITPIIKAVTDAFREIFPPITGQQLFEFTKNIRILMERLQPYPKQVDEIKRTFKGLFAILDIGWTIIKNLAKTFFDLLGFATQGSGGILEFTARIGDWLVGVRDAIKAGDGLGKFFSGLTDVLKAPITALKFILGLLVTGLQALGDLIDNNAGKAADRIQARLEPLKKFGESLGDIWKVVATAFKRALGIFAPLIDAIVKAIDTMVKKVSDSIANMDFNNALDVINTGLFGGLVLLIRKFFKNGLKIDTTGGLLDSIKSIFGGLTDTLSAMQTQLKAGTLEKIAIAIGILTVSVVALSMIDSARLFSALSALTVMFVQLGAGMAVLDKISMTGGLAKLPVITGSLILLAVAVDILTIAVAALAKLNWKELVKGLGGVGILLGELSVATKLMNPVNLITTGVGLMAVAVAVRILVTAVEDLSKLDMKSLGKGLGSVGILIGEMTAATRLMNPAGMITAGIGLTLVAVAIRILVGAVEPLAKLSVKELAKGLAGVGGLLAELVIALNLVQGAIPGALAMVIVSGALMLLAPVLKSLGDMPWDNIGRGLTMLGGSLAILAIALYLMEGAIPGSVALGIASLALLALVPALKQLGDMPWDNIGRGLTMLGASLLILAVGLTLMIVALPGALALMVAAGALAVLTPVLIALGNMSWDEIGRGLAMLAASLGIIGVAGLLLTPVIPSLIGLGVAITLLGIGTLAVGAGLFLFAAGLTALAAAGAVGTAALVAMVQSLLGLIPFALAQFAQGIISFANVIATGAPAFIGAFVALISSLLTAINTLAPQIIDTLFNLVRKLLDVLVVNVPLFVDAGMKIIIGFLRGIANNIGNVIAAAVDVIVAFLNGIGNNLGRVIQGGVDLVFKFLDGVTSAIRNNSGRLGAAGADMGIALVQGMANGIAGAVGRVIGAAQSMAGSAIESIKNFLGIHSPSRVGFELGGFTGIGFANGLVAQASLVAKGSEVIAGTAIDTLKNSLSTLKTTLTENMDTSPVIRPVLDLTAIKKDASLIPGMIQAPSLAVDTSYAKAATLAAAERVQNESVLTPEAATSGANITLIQNNNSPKALSSAEIYRQTKNQISTLKDVTTTNAN